MSPLEFVEVMAVARAEYYLACRRSSSWRARIALWDEALDAMMR